MKSEVPAERPHDRLVVVWRVTSHCNLSCGFCRYDRRQRLQRIAADERLVEAAGPRLSEYQRLGGQQVLVSWLGGEPYLWPPLRAMCHRFRHRYGLEVAVTTNGTALAAEKVRRHVVEDLAELTVSIDGLGATHDRLRRWSGGFESLRRSLSALAEEIARRGGGPLLRANVVLMRETVTQFGDLCRELARWGIGEVTFNSLGGADRPQFHRQHRLQRDDVELLASKLPSWRAELLRYGLRLRGGPSYVERIRATALGRQLSVEDCRVGDSFLFVTEAGIASPCSFTTGPYGVDLDTALIARFRGYEPVSACKDCHSTQVFAKFA